MPPPADDADDNKKEDERIDAECRHVASPTTAPTETGAMLIKQECSQHVDWQLGKHLPEIPLNETFYERVSALTTQKNTSWLINLEKDDDNHACFGKL